MDDWCKCRFCFWYDNYIGCTNIGCCQYDQFKPNRDVITEKAKETGMSVADIVLLINLEG